MKTKISEYSTTNSSNTDIEGINIDEGCPPSSINNAIRELMVHLKEFQTGASGDAFTFAGGTLMSGTNTISGAAVISGNINSSGTTNTFSGGNIFSGTNTFSGTNVFSSDVTLNAQKDLRFADSDSSNWVAFQAPATVASNVTWTLPAADGTSNQVLATNGSGTLSWATAGGGASISAGDSKVEVTDTGSNGTIVLNTDNAERMRVDASGNVGIGTTTLSGYGTNGAKIYHKATGTNINQIISQCSANDSAVTLGHNGTVALINSTFGTTGSVAPLAFYVGDAEKSRIDSTGRMLIATTTVPSGSNTAGLEVKAPNATNGQYAFAVINSAGSGYSIAFRNDGYFRSEPVYAQTSGSAANVFVDSSGYLLRSTSSIKYKKDVVDYDKGLIAVQSLRPVYYKSNRTNADGNEDSHQYAGFIAEEIDAAGLTEFVQYGEDNTPESLAYGNMVALLTKAIQELKAINDAQATRIETLEAQNAAFEARLAALEAN